LAIFGEKIGEKKLALFSKTNVTMKFLQKLVCAKTANIFAKCFGKNIF
jgi:hypothetical protein